MYVIKNLLFHFIYNQKSKFEVASVWKEQPTERGRGRLSATDQFWCSILIIRGRPEKQIIQILCRKAGCSQGFHQWLPLYSRSRRTTQFPLNSNARDNADKFCDRCPCSLPITIRICIWKGFYVAAAEPPMKKQQGKLVGSVALVLNFSLKVALFCSWSLQAGTGNIACTNGS